MSNPILINSSNNEIMSTPADFQTWWKNVATEFADNTNVIFDTSMYLP